DRMFVLPLGLGTPLKRWPVVTLTIGALWLGVAVLDRSDRVITTRLFSAAAQTGIKDTARELFREYCISRHGNRKRCDEYAVLIWTGFPDGKAKGLARHRDEDRKKSRWNPLDDLFQKDEARAAGRVRAELADC